MPTKGTYTALQRLKPIDTDFGQIAREEEALKFRYREEAATQRKKEQDEKDNISKNFLNDYKGVVEVVTKTKSIDEAYARGINSARDLIGETYKNIKNDPTLLNDVNTQLKLQNLNKYSSNLKTISDRYSEYATDVAKGLQEGKYSDWNNSALRDLDSIFRKADLDVQVDPETGLPIAVIAQQNPDGSPALNQDGTPKLKTLNLIEVLDGRGLQDTVPNFDLQESITEIGSKLGKREVVNQSGFKVTEYQKFEDIEGEVRNMIRGFVGSSDNPTDTAKSIWADSMANEAKELTDSDMKEIEDFYVTSIKGFYDEKNSTTLDQRGALQARKFKASQKKDQDKKGKFNLRTDTDGSPLKRGIAGVTGDIGGGAFSFTLPKKAVMGLKEERIEIDNLYLTNSGQLVFSGKKLLGAESGVQGDPLQQALSGGKKLSTKVISFINDGGKNVTQLQNKYGFDFNDIAIQYGFSNAGELKNHLEGIKESFTKKSEGGIGSKYN